MSKDIKKEMALISAEMKLLAARVDGLAFFLDHKPREEPPAFEDVDGVRIIGEDHSEQPLEF